ncbi:MAG: N-acetyl-gamma-glutamyl-phosphate reductase [Christensenellales bacterium]|jgi:N-acetyl-gamma-glutamyl-phosphate reductase
MKRVFIDGRNGTTGLRIDERLRARTDIEWIRLGEDERKCPRRRKEALNAADVAFLCLPDAAAREAVLMVENPDTVIIDASTAHRIAPGWAYGLPELSPAHAQAVARAKRISVPGCHASGFVALIYPLIEAGILSKDTLLSATSLTGYSGGGKQMIAEYEAADRDALLQSPKAYALSQSHKHLPEMTAATGLSHAPIFLPIVADYYSGMQVSVPLFQAQIAGTAADVRTIYRARYQGSLVRHIEEPADIGFGARLSGRDDMEITVAGNDERMLLIASFDNLGKGASGAAIECMNLACGMEIAQGLNIGRGL